MNSKKYKILYIIALSLIMSLANTSSATIIEYPLDCAGTYGFDDSWEKDFDLGVEFTKVSVSINWSGEITAGRAVYSNNPDDPFPVDVGILANFGRNPTSRLTDVYGGKQTYPNPEPFDTTSLVELHLNSTWSDLYDGKGNVKIYYTQPSLFDGYIIESGTVVLSDANLIFNGTLVPEPTSIVFLALGVFGIFGRRKRQFKNLKYSG